MRGEAIQTTATKRATGITTDCPHRTEFPPPVSAMLSRRRDLD
jgi:hypothetical protein